MKKRFSLLALSLVTLLLVGAGCWTTTVNVPGKSGAAENTNINAVVENFATLTVKSGIGEPKVLTHEIDDGMTALGLLQRFQEEGKLTITTQHFDFGDLVDGIDNVKATDQIFWSFYVNDALASVGAGDYKLQPGDTIEFRYEKM